MNTTALTAPIVRREVRATGGNVEMTMTFTPCGEGWEIEYSGVVTGAYGQPIKGSSADWKSVDRLFRNARGEWAGQAAAYGWQLGRHNGTSIWIAPAETAAYVAPGAAPQVADVPADADLTPEQQAFAAKLAAGTAARKAAKSARKGRPTMADQARARFDRELAANPTAILINPDARTGRQFEAYIDGRLVGAGDSYLAAEQARDEYLYIGLQHAHADSPADAATLTAEEVVAVAEVLLADQPAAAEVLVVNGLAEAHPLVQVAARLREEYRRAPGAGPADDDGQWVALDIQPNRPDWDRYAAATCPGCEASVSFKWTPPLGMPCDPPAHWWVNPITACEHYRGVDSKQHRALFAVAGGVAIDAADAFAVDANDPPLMCWRCGGFAVGWCATGCGKNCCATCPCECQVAEAPALTPDEAADVDALAAYVRAPLAMGDDDYCWPCGVWGACQHSPEAAASVAEEAELAAAAEAERVAIWGDVAAVYVGVRCEVYGCAAPVAAGCLDCRLLVCAAHVGRHGLHAAADVLAREAALERNWQAAVVAYGSGSVGAALSEARLNNWRRTHGLAICADGACAARGRALECPRCAALWPDGIDVPLADGARLLEDDPAGECPDCGGYGEIGTWLAPDHCVVCPCPACRPAPSVDEDLPFTPGQHEAEEARKYLAELEARDYAGRINGSVYEGECACLVGTIAKVAGVHYRAIPGLVPDGSRPIERFFLAIQPGDIPERNPFAALVAAWIDEWRATVDRVARALGYGAPVAEGAAND